MRLDVGDERPGAGSKRSSERTSRDASYKVSIGIVGADKNRKIAESFIQIVINQMQKSQCRIHARLPTGIPVLCGSCTESACAVALFCWLHSMRRHCCLLAPVLAVQYVGEVLHMCAL